MHPALVRAIVRPMLGPNVRLPAKALFTLVCSGCAGVSVSVHPRAVDVLRFTPRPPPPGFQAFPVTPARDWLTHEGRRVLDIELGGVQRSPHRTPSGGLDYLRGELIVGAEGTFRFSCAQRDGALHRDLICFIDGPSPGDRWLLALISRSPWGHRLGFMLGEQRYRIVTDAPVLHAERVFVHAYDSDEVVAVGDKEAYWLPPASSPKEIGPAIAVLLATSMTHLDNDLDHPPVPFEDQALAAFDHFEERFPMPAASSPAPDELSQQRAPFTTLVEALEERGATALAHAARIWAHEEAWVRQDYERLRSRSRTLGFTLEIFGHLGSAAGLDGYTIDGNQGAPVQGGFGGGFGPTLFRRLALTLDVGLTTPTFKNPSRELALPVSLEGSSMLYLGPRARVVFTEPDDPLAFYAGAFHHWFLGSGGSADDVVSIGFTGRRAGGFLGGELCIVGPYHERFCLYSELVGQFTWVHFSEPLGSGARGEASAEILGAHLTDTDGFGPELRFGTRFTF